MTSRDAEVDDVALQLGGDVDLHELFESVATVSASHTGSSVVDVDLALAVHVEDRQLRVAIRIARSRGACRKRSSWASGRG